MLVELWPSPSIFPSLPSSLPLLPPSLPPSLPTYPFLFSSLSISILSLPRLPLNPPPWPLPSIPSSLIFRYRAVVEKFSGSQVHILFIDYGNVGYYHTMKIKHAKKIRNTHTCSHSFRLGICIGLRDTDGGNGKPLLFVTGTEKTDHLQ